MYRKILYSFIIVFILFTQFGLRAQEYVPFPDSNVSWKIYWEPYPPDEPWTAKHYDYISSGDTLINDTQYTKLLKVDYNLYCSDIADTNYIGAYRNDIPNKIVYFYQGNEEKILYNFSLGIGDIIPTSYYIETDGTEMLVCDIDSIQIETGEYRKQYTYEFPTQPETCLYKVVEGIGFLGGLLEPMSTFPALSFNSDIICFHKHDTLQYILEWYDKCEIEEDTCIVSIVDKSRYLNKTIKVVPNPVISSAVVLFNNPLQFNSDFSFTLYNFVGKSIKTYPNIKHGKTIIHKGDLPEGIYIFVLRRKNIIKQTGKIIIKH